VAESPSQQAVWRGWCRSEQAGRQLGPSWRPAVETGKRADHDHQPRTAGWTGVTRAQGWTPGVGRLALRCGGGWRVGGAMPCQPELEVVQEGMMDRTPQPVGPDLVDALGQHGLQEAADQLLGREGHSVPTRGLRVLIATADVRHPRQGRAPAASRSAMRALTGAGTASQVGGVRGVSRAVACGLLWPRRS
jgi:hypothetical protein